MSLARVRRGLADPVAQSFRVHVQLLSGLAERRARLGFRYSRTAGSRSSSGYFRGPY